MKLPRWLVIAMLTASVLSVLAAAGWWWVTWPERTARLYVELFGEGRIEEAESITCRVFDKQTLLIVPPAEIERSEWNPSFITFRKRTWRDVLGCRQKFAIASLGWKSPAMHYVEVGRRAPLRDIAGIGWLEFTAERGQVIQKDFVLIYHDPQLPGFTPFLPKVIPPSAKFPEKPQ